jgi:hypothetical protein
MTDEQKIRLRYQVALAQFRKHPPMIWKRNDFFLLIQAGLLAFTVNQNSLVDANLGIMAYAAGLLLALVWFWVTVAGQRLLWNWRDIVIESEKSLFKDTVKGPFQMANEKGEEGRGRNVTVNITLALKVLSGGFVIMWLALLYLRFSSLIFSK